MFHTWTWVVWLIAASIPAFTLRNPLYQVLVLGCAWLVYTALGRTTVVGSSWGSFVKIGLFFLLLAIPINALSIHVGRLVLFSLPESWPIVGGPITMEAIIAGLVSGLALLTILVVFAAFNAVVDHYQLLQATPAFLFQAGVVISIAVTFVPQMVLSAKEIRQAQRVRGHRFRGIRDLLPLVMPLLANGLERAIQLAETLEARGFGSSVESLSRRQLLMSQAGTLLGLLGLLAGLVVAAFVPGGSVWGLALSILGVLVMLTVFTLQGRRVHRTRYRRPRWHARDLAVVVACLTVAVVVVGAKQLVPETLVYSPYPPFSLWPPFDPVVGGVLLLLALPALIAPRPVQDETRSAQHETGNRTHDPI